MSSSQKFLDLYPVPMSLKEHLLPCETSLLAFSSQQKVLYWSEICFVVIERDSAWRFMGVSLNRGQVGRNKNKEELASSIFRSDPVQDIDPPWECIYTFCETALQSSLGRIALPFVCVSSMSAPHRQYYFPLRNFNYQNRNWKMSVSSLSNLSVE